MDGSRFDHLTKSLAQGTSRRRLLKGIAGVVAGALVGSRLSETDAACPTGAVPAAGGRCICKNSGRPPVNGSCTSGGGTSGCGAGQMLCGTTCVDASSDPNNCGACGRVCTPINNATSVACLAGQCWVASCAPGFADCNATGFDGCETQLGTNQNCGACGDACTGFTTCGGGGTPGVCGCTPGTCESLALNCGTHDDGCGGTLDCTACPFGQTCSGGVCKTNNGDGCLNPAECASGYCVGGICCDRACDGECRSCATGTCQDRSGACGPAGTCGGTCQAGECSLTPINTPCGTATCSTPTQAHLFSCDGNGHCIEIINNCGLNLCRDGACLTTCQTSDDCVGAAFCDNGTCREDRAAGQACTEDAQCLSGHCVGSTCCQQACNAPSGATAACSADGQTCGFTCSSGSPCGNVCCPDGRTCCASLDGQSHTCCAPGGECINGACSVTCLAYDQACDRDNDQCCPGEGIFCGVDVWTFDTKCCYDLGGPCFNEDTLTEQSGQGCCFQTVPGTSIPLAVGCGNGNNYGNPGVCGGKGAECTHDAACASGICCGGFRNFCCGAGEACGADGVCRPNSGACDGPDDCAGGLCCNGECVESNDDHCATCTDVCPADRTCVNGQCRKPIGAACTTGDECADGFCYSGTCCDECGGLCGKPRGNNTTCKGDVFGLYYVCCEGQCIFPDFEDPTDPYHCGCTRDQICPVGDNCSGDGLRCGCQESGTCNPDGVTISGHSCNSNVSSTCTLDVEGELFCAWTDFFVDLSEVIPCGDRCESNDECPAIEVCKNGHCSSTWRCAHRFSTCCTTTGGSGGVPVNSCVLVTPEGRDT